MKWFAGLYSVFRQLVLNLATIVLAFKRILQNEHQYNFELIAKELEIERIESF